MGRAVPIIGDEKTAGADSRKPDVNSASRNLGRLSLQGKVHVDNRSLKNRARVDPQPRPSQTLKNKEHVSSHSLKNKAGIEPQLPPSPRPEQPKPARPRPAKKERLEDVFQDEIVKRFPKMSEFKKFARSRDGLQLKTYEVETIMEDYRSSEEQRVQMLFRWSEKLGKNATPQRIRDLVDGFYAEYDQD